MTIRAALHTLFGRPVTLLILPADSLRTVRIRLPAAALGATLLLIAAILVAGSLLAGRHIHYEAMRLMNAHMASE